MPTWRIQVPKHNNSWRGETERPKKDTAASSNFIEYPQTWQ